MAVETKKRSFKQIREKKDFFDFCKKIAEEYASLEDEFARTYFTEKYNISINCFYHILEEAVILNMISDNTIFKMEEKAVRNQKCSYAKAMISSRKHYDKLWKKRKEYLDSFTEEDIKNIATKFAYYTDISKKSFAIIEGISQRTLEIILQRAILEVIINDEIFFKIRERSLCNASNEEEREKSEIYFEYLLTKRNSKVKGTA